MFLTLWGQIPAFVTLFNERKLNGTQLVYVLEITERLTGSVFYKSYSIQHSSGGLITDVHGCFDRSRPQLRGKVQSF